MRPLLSLSQECQLMKAPLILMLHGRMILWLQIRMPFGSVSTTSCTGFVQFRVALFFSDEAWLISFIASGLVSNSVAEILGRKRSLIIDCIAFLLGYSLYAMAGNVTTLCIARAFLGYPLVNTVCIMKVYKNHLNNLIIQVFII